MYLIAQGGIQISETGTDSTDVPLRNMNCVMWRMLDNCLKPRSVQTRWRLKKFRISPERFFFFFHPIEYSSLYIFHYCGKI